VWEARLQFDARVVYRSKNTGYIECDIADTPDVFVGDTEGAATWLASDGVRVNNNGASARSGTNEEGRVTLTFARVDRPSRLWLGLHENDSPRLVLADDQGQMRAALGEVPLRDLRTGSVESRSPSSLVLFGQDRKSLFKVP